MDNIYFVLADGRVPMIYTCIDWAKDAARSEKARGREGVSLVKPNNREAFEEVIKALREAIDRTCATSMDLHMRDFLREDLQAVQSHLATSGL